MRLTLRTMLAYLDGVLDPADTDTLGKKIQESDFASGLSQRLKAVLKKVRLEAPKLDAKGLGNDANTVAEYLDSSLPQDRVGDFERICLESDKHLAEVGACHQILTLVLGKPADVPEEMRARIYALQNPEQPSAPALWHPAGAHPATAHSPTAAREPVASNTAVVAPIVPSPPPAPRVPANGKPALQPPLLVPDYLRAGRQRTAGPIAALLVAAIALIAAGVWLLRSDGAARFFKSMQIAMNAPADSAQPANGEKTEPVATEPGKESAPDSAASVAVLPTTPPVNAELEKAAPPLTAPPIPDVAPTTAPPVSLPPAAEPAPPPAAAPPLPMPMPVIPDVPAEAKPPAPDANAPKTAPPPSEQRSLVEVGRYTSDIQLLASLDPSDGLWKRKITSASVFAGERLIVLPPYRPQLAVPGAQVTFVNQGGLQMDSPGELGSRLKVDYGRLIVVAVGAAGAQLDLDLGGVKGIATLVDADSSLAIRVARWLPPGVDPEAVVGLTIVELFNTKSRVTWQEVGQDRVEITPKHVLSYIGPETPRVQGPFQSPDWVDVRNTPPIDRQASLSLESLLDQARPLTLALQEASQDRRVEVRSLSARCQVVLDEFEPMIRELSDARQYSFWNIEIDALKAALNRSPQAAADIKATLERLRGADAAELYRLLWGYGPEQLEKGAAAQLVKFLEHEQMDVRVLAFHNLVAITGAQEYYRPERLPGQMKAPIQNWKDRLAKGGITYKAPPSPLEALKPLAGPAALIP